MKQVWYDPEKDEIMLLEVYSDHCLHFIGSKDLEVAENIWRCYAYPPGSAGLIYIGDL